MKPITIENLQAEGYKPAPAEYSTGQAWLKALIVPDDTTNCIISDVFFEAGTRNHWHTHPGNQILMVKQGLCYFQEEGKPVQIVKAGGIINILPGVKHWHGAPPDDTMVHTAIGINTEKGIVNWLEPVSDEQYRYKM